MRIKLARFAKYLLTPATWYVDRATLIAMLLFALLMLFLIRNPSTWPSGEPHPQYIHPWTGE